MGFFMTIHHLQILLVQILLPFVIQPVYTAVIAATCNVATGSTTDTYGTAQLELKN